MTTLAMTRHVNRVARHTAACNARVRRMLPHAALAATLAVAPFLGIGHAAAAPDHAMAIIRPVTNCADGGPGSLREAFTDAADGDEIDLSQLGCTTISLSGGALVNAHSGIVFVRGVRTADGRPAITIAGNHADRVFHKTSGELSLEDLAITAGSYGGAEGGGCIAVAGPVWLTRTSISDCSVTTTGSTKARGGAIVAGAIYLDQSSITASRAHAASADSDGGATWTMGITNLRATTISGNATSGDGSHFARGGGIYAGGILNCVNSTIAGNRADTGGGVFVAGTAYSVRIENSTVSGNEANAWAGGLMIAPGPSSVNILASTITANRVPSGSHGGAYLSGAAAVESTIIAGNTVSDGLQDSDLGGAPGATVAGTHNLIIASDLVVPADTLALAPKLGPLQDNGGYTWTHALLADSPAIDRGVAVGPRDQRMSDGHGHDFPRVIGISADIGAYEYGADGIFADGFE